MSIFPYTLIQKLLAGVMRKIAGEQESSVDEGHLANRAVLQYLKTHSVERSTWTPDYYYLPHYMQANDELDYKLSKLGELLPKRCYAVCYGYPILAHPGGVIFAVASDRYLVFLRLPDAIREKALTSIAREVVHIEGDSSHPPISLHSSEFGNDWVFLSPWHDDQSLIQELLLTAYGYAGELAQASQ